MHDKQIIEKYDNIYKFINTINNRPNNGFFGKESEKSDTESFYFTKTHNYQEATSQFENGLIEETQQLKRDIQQFKQKQSITIQKSIPINYYYGYAPNIPAAIIGLPKSMKYNKKTPQKIKAVSIYYNITANANIDADTLYNSGKTVLQLIYYLESQNIRTNLYIIPSCTDCYDNDLDAICIIRLKEYKQPIDILKMSFPLVSPSMFRRFGFKWKEGLNGLNLRQSGYGRSYKIEEARKVLENKIESNSFLINYELCENNDFDAVQLAKNLNIVK